MTLAAVFQQADVLTPLINSVTPGIAVLIILTVVLTAAAITLRSMSKQLDKMEKRLGDIEVKAITKESLEFMLLKLERRLDERYDGRFLHAERRLPRLTDEGSPA